MVEGKKKVFKKNDRLRLKIVEVFGTQEKCSAITGLNEADISRLVRGIRPPTDYQKRTLSKSLGISPEDIFG